MSRLPIHTQISLWLKPNEYLIKGKVLTFFFFKKKKSLIFRLDRLIQLKITESITHTSQVILGDNSTLSMLIYKYSNADSGDKFVTSH